MEVDAMQQQRDQRCFKCGKADGHIARFCPTPVAEIRSRWGRDSMYQPGGRPVQNRATNFANAGEWAAALSPADRVEALRALQTGGAQGANQAPPANPPGFAGGSA